MLVDDEPLVLEGLKAMVNWENYGFKISGTAEDGEDGYELIQRVNPDLVFTDIRMPGMDGLALIKKCQSLSALKTKFIILSGYNDFQYVKEALSLRSLSYVLKPIDSDEIEAELLKLSSQLQEKDIEQARMQQQIDFVLQATMKRILLGEDKASLYGRLKFILNLTMPYQLRLIQFEGVSDAKKLETLIDEWQEPLKKVLLELEESRFVAILLGEDPTTESCISWLDDRKQDSRSCFVKAFLGEEFLDIQQLRDAYKRLRQCEKQVFYYPEAFYYMERHYRSEILSEEKVNALFDYKQMTLLIKEKELESVLKALQHIIIGLKHMRLEPNQLQYHYLRFLGKCAQEFGLDQPKTRNFQWKEILNFDIFVEVMQEDINKLYEQVRHSDHVGFERITSYIMQHINEDIKLKKVAKELGFNAIYLGQLFQKNTGLKYNDFVLYKRLEQAKVLLAFSSLQLKEIAHEVGFKHPDYFVQKFKEVEGCSPTSYRQKRMETNEAH